MNMSSQTNIITTEEYFQILGKENLSDIERIQKERYEKHIKLSQQYEDFLSPAAQNVLNVHNSRTMELGNKENKTLHEENVLKDFQSAFESHQNNLEHEGPVRRLAQSGFIDAGIILAILLNVGFIIAMAILG